MTTALRECSRLSLVRQVELRPSSLACRSALAALYVPRSVAPLAYNDNRITTHTASFREVSKMTGVRITQQAILQSAKISGLLIKRTYTSLRRLKMLLADPQAGTYA